MLDPRMTKLAKMLVNYSCEIKEGEKVYISTSGIPAEMNCELIKELSKVLLSVCQTII